MNAASQRAPHNAYLWAAALIVAAGLVLHLIPLPGDPVIGDMTDTGHVLGFATLAFVLLRGFALRHEQRPVPRSWRPYLLAAALALAFGAAAEALQIPFHRDASWGDLARDSCGIAAGLLAAYAGSVLAARRAAVILAALLVLLGGLFGPGRKLAARLAVDLRWPVLVNFDSALDLTLLERHDASVAEVPAPAGWSEAGRVGLVRTDGASRYAGIGFFALPRDWSAYETLTFRAAAAQKTPLTLHVRINDAEHDNTYADRFNRRFTLDSTPRTIRIPLAEVRRAPASRRMDMKRIVDITFFVSGGSPSAFYLDRIELQGEARRGRTAGGSL
jgi:hypothetical protein